MDPHGQLAFAHCLLRQLGVGLRQPWLSLHVFVDVKILFDAAGRLG
jgi:hypothetical protein